jgi:hypothetical protein
MSNTLRTTPKAQAAPELFIADRKEASTIKNHFGALAELPWKKQTRRTLTDFMNGVYSSGHTHGPGRPKRAPIANRQEAATLKRHLRVLSELPWKKQTRRVLIEIMIVITSSGHTHGPGKPGRTRKSPAA